jgi:hypothetical protein
VRTNVRGTFLIEEVPPGVPLRVVIEAKGYPSMRRTIGPLPDWEVEEIEVRMLAGHPVSARLLDENDVPVPHATIHLIGVGEEEAPRKWDGTPAARGASPVGQEWRDVGRTDAFGSFRLDAVRPGVYQLGVEVSGLEVLAGGFLTARREALMNLTFRVALGPTLRGRVVDGAGRPVAGATLTGRLGGGSRSARIETESGEDGGFLFRLGKAGAVDLLVVRADGHCEARRKGVAAGDRSVEIVLPAAGRIEGMVQERAGEPVTLFRVRAHRRAGAGEQAPHCGRGPSPGSEAIGFNDRDGLFALEDLAPGTYDLTVEAEGYAAGRVEGIEVGGGRSAPLRTVVLLAEEPAEAAPAP